ncbi:uncharacterized protein PRCAT00005215001 [Priceomyces carsonii]|uniref:uncharacterized protein n=1 Tax=Priceomyces carsonii TaxID=28549 RepID=UPI002EDA223E|nr:unnamed protein product [Priceomyces carsonii]
MSEPTINFHIQTRLTLFKIPCELIKKNFKNVQKLVEKQKKLLTEDIGKIRKNPNLPSRIKLEMIRKLIKSFEGFQRKLATFAERDEEYRSRIIVRLENLAQLTQYTNLIDVKAPRSGSKELEDDKQTPTGDDFTMNLHNTNLINWYRDQANLLIVDYLIKSNTSSNGNIGLLLLKNLSKTNPKFSKLIDYDLFENFNNVFVSIVEHHDLSLIISWFSENRNSLRKANSNLEFEINYCKFLSLIEKGDVSEAINFSKEHLSSYGNRENYQQGDVKNHESNLKKLKEIGGLLVYVAINKSKPLEANGLSFSSSLVINSPRFQEYEKLLSDERWTSLAECFTKNFTDLYGISKNYPLFIYLSAGLSSLKTKSCYCNYENTIFRTDDRLDSSEVSDISIHSNRKYRGPNYYYRLLDKINNCPVCSPELYNLSKNLPYAQLITSIFNNPFKLPNGNIYPFEKLLNPSEKYLSEKNTLLRMGKVKDPLTKEVFLIDHCVKVYPA